MRVHSTALAERRSRDSRTQVGRDGRRRARVIPVTFPARASSTSKPVEPAPVGDAPSTPWVYVSGSVAVVGIAGFAFFGLTALSDHAAMRDGCALTHSCSDDAVQSNRAGFWIADASARTAQNPFGSRSCPANV